MYYWGMFNFLYCFDKNYNKMAFTSMISLLDTVDEKINIFIIHQKKSINKIIPEKIQHHKNLNNLEIFEFSNLDNKFPNVKTSHISDATYYRLFLDEYLDSQLDFLIYLDADVVAISNPLPYFGVKIKNIINKNYAIAAYTHETIPKNDKRSISLGITKGKYFNAGVMVIDMVKWQELEIKKQAIKIIEEKNEKLTLWDQDVLNIIFNGNYEEIQKEFNYNVNLLTYSSEDKKYIDEKISLLHYFGKTKPWSISGLCYEISEYYQKEYRKIYSNKYHVVSNDKKTQLKKLILILKTGQLSSKENYSSFLKASIVSFFK